MVKGKDTKNAILEVGLDMATQLGLECVTIGALAKTAKMSKSGVFAHFASKENLQMEILRYAGHIFAESVVLPALKIEAGIPRIRALVANWIRWGADWTGGCIFVSASTEFADRPGKVRDVLLRQQEEWIDSLKRMAESAVKVGEFREGSDCEQFAFDLYSLLLGFNLYHKLLNSAATKLRQETALDRLLNNYRSEMNLPRQTPQLTRS
ncbi:MAG: TetR/AcrR family transcriptional regulator [Deltaproteobacteria bacterium]|nr:TetR/AcrR family transcriptional regulator [Deltaproteobacteria bacterium]